MENGVEYINKLDIFKFDYTDDVGMIRGYIVGKDITDNKERYITTMSINPNSNSDVDTFYDFLLFNNDSIDGKTIVVDIRLLNDNVIDVIRDAYIYRKVLGIRIVPDGSTLTKELYDKFNNLLFKGFLITVDKVDREIEFDGNLDIRVQDNICKVEHIKYNNGQDVDHYNVHVTRMLSDSDIGDLVSKINDSKCDQIYLDYYNPAYYKRFLSMLNKYGLRDDVKIILLANPLYDAISCYEGYENIIDNHISINYNTCDDLNVFFSREPYTEGVKYYSDIEASGKTDSSNYYEMLKTIDEVVKHMDKMNYSPLEKYAYLEDYFKDNFIYDPDYLVTAHADNAHLDKIYKKDRMVCEGFSNLYSVILRRSGELCFTYGTDNHQKNIARIKDKKYGVDSLVLLDTTNDLGSVGYGNEFNLFLVPIDNDIYAQDPEVISISNALIMSTSDYFKYIKDSNPVYATDPIGYAIRMLQLMGLSHGDRVFSSYEEQIEFYKAALANSNLLHEIPDSDIVNAIMEVRKREGKYDNNQGWDNFSFVLANVESRGNDHALAPAIKMLSTGDLVGVSLFDVTNSKERDSRFTEVVSQDIKYHRPREKDIFEIQEEYDNYLERFYSGMFHDEDVVDNKVEVEEFVIDDINVDEVNIYRDLNDSGRVFAEEEVFNKFGIKLPKTIYNYGNRKLYELSINNAIDILNNANNKNNPYIINYSYIDSRDFIEDKVNANKNNLVIFRDVKRPDLLYIRKSDYDNYGFDFDIEEITISGLDCCALDQGDLSYIIGMSKNNGFDINYRDLEINVKNMVPVYKEVPNQVVTIYRNDDGKLYITKELFEGLHFNTNAVEVILNGLSLYEIDENNYAYIIRGASNKYNAYKVVVSDVRINNNEETASDLLDREYIPGTKFLKPRIRGPYESDNDYVAYLEEYYNSIFGNKENAKVKM